MIAGVSHLVLGSTAPDIATATLAGLGWGLAFVEKEIRTEPAKRPFMITPSAAQTLAFLRRDDHVAVEVIHYDRTMPSAGAPFRLVLPQPPSTVATVTGPPDPEEAAIADTLGMTARTSPGLATPLWFGAGGASAPAVVHLTSSPADAFGFWSRGLGLRTTSLGPSVQGRGVFRLAAPASRTPIHLVVGPAASPPPYAALDGAGFRCLSFHTTDLDGDGETLLSHGATACTGPMLLRINQRSIRAAIFACLDGCFVELIQPWR